MLSGMTCVHPESASGQDSRRSTGAFLKVGENLYRRKATRVYYALVKRGRKQFRRSLKTTDRKLAEIFPTPLPHDSCCRLRQRCRELLRQEVVRTVDRPEEVELEIRHLFLLLSG